MNVRERRRIFADALSRQVPSGAELVVEPDHPLLLDGPDILLGSRSGLWAFFLSSRAELLNPDRMYSRVVLSRLALPRHAVFIRVVISDDETVPPWQHSVFGPPLAGSDVSNLRDRLAGRPTSDSAIPADVTLAAQQRFSNSYRLSYMMFRDHTWLTHDNEFRALRTPKDVKLLPEGIEAVRWEKGRATLSQVRDWVGRTTRSHIDLSNGVPILSGARVRVGLIDEYPRFRGDPEKAIRAASFAGLTLIPHNKLERFREVIARLGSGLIDHNQ